VVYQEYKNYGPGATGARVNFSSQASKPVKAGDILGTMFVKETWVDADYL
jgi:pectinesterase